MRYAKLGSGSARHRLRALFDLLRGPAATSAAAAVRWQGLLLTVIDGTTMSVADAVPVIAGGYGEQRCNHGGSGYPGLRLSLLLTCGTRSVIDATFDPITTGELDQARTLARSLHAGMLLLADRNYAAADLIKTLAATKADLLIRCKTSRRLPIITRHRDGSWQSTIGTTRVRVIDAQITVRTAEGTRTGDYRLITTLLDAHRHPAGELIKLYHQRWEIETAYLELKSTILGGRVLRARTPAGIDQEVYALLTAYQALRLAMTGATDHDPHTTPDRASFTIALNTARDQVIHAAGVITGTVIDLVGGIGRAVLNDLLPERRTRISPRVVKRAISKHRAKGHIDRTNHPAAITITLGLTPSPEP